MTRRAPLTAVVLALLLVAGGTVPVLAHAALVASAPAAGSTVSGVTEVNLAFNEVLGKGVSSFKLVGPDGSTIGTGTTSSPRTMSLTGLSLRAGEHTVKWTAAGDDGHIERATFRFTVEAAVATEAPAATEAPSTAVPVPAAPATEVPVVAAAPASTASAATPVKPETAPASTSGTDVLLPIVGGLVVVGFVGALVLRRSRAA